jgi:hypothetical protein
VAILRALGHAQASRQAWLRANLDPSRLWPHSPEKRGVYTLPTRSTSVSRAQIVASLKRTQGHALFFFDTCHAGSAAIGGATRGDQTYQPFIDEMRDASNGVLVLASSEGRQLSQDDLDFHDVSVLAMLEALEEAYEMGRRAGDVETLIEANGLCTVLEAIANHCASEAFKAEAADIGRAYNFRNVKHQLRAIADQCDRQKLS